VQESGSTELQTSSSTSSNNAASKTKKKKKSNFTRNKSDFMWIALMMVALVYLGEKFYPSRTPIEQLPELYQAFNVGGRLLPQGSSLWQNNTIKKNNNQQLSTLSYGL